MTNVLTVIMQRGLTLLQCGPVTKLYLEFLNLIICCIMIKTSRN